MIREFKIRDKDNLIEILKKGFVLDDNDVKDFLKDQDRKLIVYDEGGIWGFAYLKNTNEETKEYCILIYVDPHWRRKGIGTALYNSLYADLQKLKPNLLTTYFRVGSEDFKGFYRKLGYKKWWGCHEAYYKGSFQPEVNLNFVHYKDAYFHEYTKLIQDGFYELRRENDIKPYRCDFDDRYREYLLNNKDYIYVLFKNNEMIATAVVKDGYLDNIVVTPPYQGKGLGKKVTQFAINKAIEQAPEGSIHLTVLTWNKKAIKLYEDLGFEIVHTVHFYRQLFDKEF
jgi:ribosomal protein S18 acetylase RimI-like enzyme